MTHEVGPIAHQLGDVLGVGQEVLTVGDCALPVAAPVGHQQAKSLVGEGPLGIPLFGAGCQRAVHQHHGGAFAPRLDVQVARSAGLLLALRAWCAR